MSVDERSIPVLETRRLVLRPFQLEDGPEVQELAGAWEIADTTANIPHPYPDGAAEAWIEKQGPAWREGTSATFAVCLRPGSPLLGAIGLAIDRGNRSAEMGYWIGVKFWKQGYCTEAAGAVVAYGFDALGLERICARHMTRNPASGRVMEKIGMRREGILRRSIYRWDVFEDAAIYALLREDRPPGPSRES